MGGGHESLTVAGLRGGSMNVLIVDDQRTSLTLVAKYVELMGGKPFPLSDPIAALAEALKTRFALAVVDYKMPVMDGISFVKVLRSFPNAANVPILMVSVDDTATVKRAAMAAGVSA